MPSTRSLYGFAIFLSAFLLFLVEPMAAKQLLPALGGSSAVWLTCLVFFQLTLLLGYLYAHWLTRRPFNRGLRLLYFALLAIAIALLAAQKFIRPNLSRGSEHPVATIFFALTLTIGLPFLLLGSTSPLLQIWLFRKQGGHVPYRLFALSNVGSLLALVAYPTLVEPHLTLKLQRSLWAVGFMVYAVLCAILSRQVPATTQATPQESPDTLAPSTSSATRWLWFLLPMAAAMQLSAVTSHITSNIAAIPLLWILPLAVYLITFILAFEFPRFYRRSIVVRLMVVMLASLGYAISKMDTSIPIGLAILFFLFECFIACLFCHAEAYALRPRRPSETTLFYLLVAAGGVTGTFFIGIASPLIFAANYDLSITFLVTALLALAVAWPDGWGQRLLWATASVLVLFLNFALHAAYKQQTLLETRNFYGSLRVKASVTREGQPLRSLLNGTIQHGNQIFSPGFTRIPTTYYAKDSGIGLALANCCAGRARNIGVVGLGTGTIAAYGNMGDRIRFYEINPHVEPIARNLFTYLRDSPAAITVTEGDARTSLAQETPQHFDVLVLDAFSGDAIPLHLLTTEALRLYQKHLAPNGILAFHVSNQYLNLAPEVAQLAASIHMQSRLFDTATVDARGEFRSTWVLVTASPTFFMLPEVALIAAPITAVPGLSAWTDDYSSLLPIFQPTGH
ncbi:MAG TPA: fused MFS/spermidine synthase [Edaphobacter sp.]|uniref:fused MFS/spermidine synthase n=1 Tax=Edaphobacter sp. TaxID=1934404 RepID=UPI002CE6FA67|nr:fused MFS/spermidine synthase [Edaphobacter sp.]HUZ93880.1 fused MFS/spermidine synthase [Edaphobacter sp.]